MDLYQTLLDDTSSTLPLNAERYPFLRQQTSRRQSCLATVHPQLFHPPAVDPNNHISQK